MEEVVVGQKPFPSLRLLRLIPHHWFDVPSMTLLMKEMGGVKVGLWWKQ